MDENVTMLFLVRVVCGATLGMACVAACGPDVAVGSSGSSGGSVSGEGDTWASSTGACQPNSGEPDSCFAPPAVIDALSTTTVTAAVGLGDRILVAWRDENTNTSGVSLLGADSGVVVELDRAVLITEIDLANPHVSWLVTAQLDGDPEDEVVAVVGEDAVVVDVTASAIEAGSRVPLGLGGRGMVALDYDGDGRDELLRLDASFEIGALSVDGWTPVTTTLPFPPCAPGAMAVGDFDGDGRDDVVVHSDAEWFVPLSSCNDGPPATHDLFVLFNRFGSAGVEPEMPFEVHIGPEVPYLTYPRDIVAGDVSGDGLSEIVIATYQAESPQLLVLSGGPSAFTALPGPATDPSIPLAALVGDFDGDGVDDVLVHNAAEGRDGFWTSDDGFSTLYGLPPFTARPLAAADLNGDGIDDVLLDDTPPLLIVSNARP